MKKLKRNIFLPLFLLFLVVVIPGCNNESKAIKPTSTIEQIQELENHESSEAESKSLNSQSDDALMVLSQEEQYRINIFLSNFSEQWFHEDSPEEFKSKDADPMDMIEFACLYLKLNRNDNIEFLTHNGYPYATLSIEMINSVTQRFFNRTVALDDVVSVPLFDDYYNYIVIDDMVYFVWGDGETYNNMTVVKEMYDLGNGTMRAEFNIYSINIDNYDLIDIGGIIRDKSVYYYTQNDAEKHSDFELHLSGEAFVKPYVSSSGKETYQLISYKVFEDKMSNTD